MGFEGLAMLNIHLSSAPWAIPRVKTWRIKKRDSAFSPIQYKMTNDIQATASENSFTRLKEALKMNGSML